MPVSCRHAALRHTMLPRRQRRQDIYGARRCCHMALRHVVCHGLMPLLRHVDAAISARIRLFAARRHTRRAVTLRLLIITLLYTRCVMLCALRRYAARRDKI